MSTWHGRMFPYPLLAPWTDDYEEPSSFGVEVPEAILNNGRKIKVELAFQLFSVALDRLINSNEAGYAVEVSCPRTFARTTHMTDERQTLVLDASEYDEELLLTPYLVSKGDIDGFTSVEHASEWRTHRPGGFSVPTAGILAVGHTTRITLEDSSVNSVIDLVSNSRIPNGSFTIELDDDRIKIHVPEPEKKGSRPYVTDARAWSSPPCIRDYTSTLSRRLSGTCPIMEIPAGHLRYGTRWTDRGTGMWTTRYSATMRSNMPRS